MSRLSLFCWRLVIPLTLLFLGKAMAQEYHTGIRHLTVEDGLSGRFCKDIQEDAQGFIWLMTWNGLNRYDGFSFKLYSKADYGFRLEDYDQLELDAANRLWLIKLNATEKGRSSELGHYIDVFDLQTEQLVSSEIYQALPFEREELVRIVSGPDQKLWFQDVQGQIYAYDGNRFRSVLKAVEGEFCPLADGGLVMIDQEAKEVLRYGEDGKQLSVETLPAGFFQLTCRQQDGFVLGTTKNNNQVSWQYYSTSGKRVELVFRNENQEPIVTTFNNDLFRHQLWRDEWNRWWLTDGTSLQVFDTSRQRIAYFPADKTSQKHLFHLSFDRYQNAWASTGDGAYLHRVRKNLFPAFVKRERLIDTRGIAELPNGKLWISQEKVCELDVVRGEEEIMDVEGGRDVYADRAGRMWLGRYGAVGIRCNPETRQQDSFFCVDVPVEELYEVGTNRFIQRTGDDTIFVGTLGRGLYTVDLEKQVLQPYSVPEDFKLLRTADIHSFYENHKGLWIGTNVGLFLLEPQKGITQHFPFQTEYTEQQLIHAIYEDQQGVFWLGTFNHGLIRWQPESSDFRFYTQEDGLTDNTIYAIYEDRFGTFWMPSNFGLMRMDKFTKEVNTYVEADGLPHKEFNSTSHLKTKDGRLVFGGLKGVVAFYPEMIEQQQRQDTARVVFSQLTIISDSSQTILAKSALQTPSAPVNVRLKELQSELHLELSALDKWNPDKSQFAWRSVGAETWNTLTGNQLELRSIPYGKNKYVFRGRTQGGAWVIYPQELIVQRERPAYVRFLIPVLLACMGLVYGLFWWIRKNRSTPRNQSQPTDFSPSAVPSVENTSTPTTAAPPVTHGAEPPPPVKHLESVSNLVEEGLPTAFEQWLAELNQKALQLIEEQKFSIVDLAEAMNMSDRQLRRKMKQNDYIPPAAYLREIRLQKARQLLKSRRYATVAEVCYAVGFSTPKHFSRLFQERFGQRPSSYMEEQRAKEEEE